MKKKKKERCFLGPAPEILIWLSCNWAQRSPLALQVVLMLTFSDHILKKQLVEGMQGHEKESMWTPERKFKTIFHKIHLSQPGRPKMTFLGGIKGVFCRPKENKFLRYFSPRNPWEEGWSILILIRKHIWTLLPISLTPIYRW